MLVMHYIFFNFQVYH